MACFRHLPASIYCCMLLVAAVSTLHDRPGRYQQHPSVLSNQLAGGQLLGGQMERLPVDVLYDPIEAEKREGVVMGIYPFHRPSCGGLWERCHPLFPHLTRCEGSCKPGYSIKACRRIRNQGFRCIQMRQH